MMLHPDFTLNNQCFSDLKELEAYCSSLLRQDEFSDAARFILEWLDQKEYIEVQTSGSTGKPQQIRIQKKHALNSAKATIAFFNLPPGTRALLCLSAEYIAGKMMLVRAMAGGWNLHIVPAEKNPLEKIKDSYDFTAMVPYQVFHSLNELNRVKKIIIGGGGIPKNLENELQNCHAELFATYGMTETISHVAIRPVNGKNKTDVFTALPEVNFSQNETGCLQIEAPKIAEKTIETNDVVQLLSPVSFRFLGRKDNIINSGGIKIFPESVEAVLSGFLKIPFFIASEKDEALGERLILLAECESSEKILNLEKALQALPSSRRPKKIYCLPEFVYTETEKIQRKATLEKLKK